MILEFIMRMRVIWVGTTAVADTIIRQVLYSLTMPIQTQTSVYQHFGKKSIDRMVEQLKKKAGLEIE